MIMLMNLTKFLTKSTVPHLTKFLTKSHRVICRRKRIQNFNENEGNEKEGQNIKEKDETSKEKTGNLDIHKNRYYHQPKASVERKPSTFSSANTGKRKKIVLFSDSILKNLRIREFNCFIKKGEVSLKAFPRVKARQITTPSLSLKITPTIQQPYISV